MSRTLNLVRRLLAKGRNLHKLGFNHEALLLLSKLSSFRDLPAQVAEEVQRRLAAILLRQRKYARARHHLAALLLRRPDCPGYHHLMARAVAKDAKADPKKAVAHYRQALALAPDRPRCLADLGLAALRAGRPREGLRSLRRALELAPDNAAIVGKAVEGLGQRGRYREARRVLHAALFRNPRAPRLRRLWDDLRFREARAAQEADRRATAAVTAGDDAPVLLPFVPPPDGTTPARPARRLLRLDAAATLPHPHLPRALRRKDHKHAQ